MEQFLVILLYSGIEPQLLTIFLFRKSIILKLLALLKLHTGMIVQFPLHGAARRILYHEPISGSLPYKIPLIFLVCSRTTFKNLSKILRKLLVGR